MYIALYTVGPEIALYLSEVYGHGCPAVNIAHVHLPPLLKQSSSRRSGAIDEPNYGSKFEWPGDRNVDTITSIVVSSGYILGGGE